MLRGDAPLRKGCQPPADQDLNMYTHFSGTPRAAAEQVFRGSDVMRKSGFGIADKGEGGFIYVQFKAAVKEALIPGTGGQGKLFVVCLAYC